MLIKEIKIGGPIGVWFVNKGWGGITLPLLPWLTIILYWGGNIHEPSVRLHESVHVVQRLRYGWLGFWFKYTLGAFKGYLYNPLEEEALGFVERATLDDWEIGLQAPIKELVQYVKGKV